MGGPEPDIIDDPTAGPPVALGSYDVVGIEITQAVQDLGNTVALVAGKSTVVRVYLERPDVDAVTVRGELEVTSDAGGEAVVPSMNLHDLNPAANGDVTAKRLRLDGALNFRVPDALTIAGMSTLTLRAVRLAESGRELLPIASAPVRVEFLETPPLRVRLITFRYETGNPPKEHEPSAIDYTLIESWLRRAYPISALQLSRLTVAGMKPWTNKASAVNVRLTAMRNADISAGGDPLAHYYGLVADSGGFMRGLASVIPSQADPSAVASGPTGPRRYSWDTDGSYGDWYTGHELAHTFGRRHLGSGCGDTPTDPTYPHPDGQISGPDDRFVGFDVGDPALGLPMCVYRGTEYHDLMSYCPFVWVSGFTYSRIRDRLEAESTSAAGPGLGPFGLSDLSATIEVERAMGKWLNVVGAINFSRGTGSIDVMQPFTARDAPAGDDGRAELRTYDAEGRLLGTFPARVKLDECRDGDEETGILDSFVPAPPSAVRVELAVLGAPVDERTSSALAGPSNMAGVTAADRGGQFTVQVSVNDGETWQTVAAGAESPDYDLRRSDFPGAKTIRMRVMGTDGFESWLVREERIE